ncbi:MAG: hypothetical protein AB7E55_21880 [Pigmentiphaga sp.]
MQSMMTLLRVVQLNHWGGLMDEHESWGLDADDVRSSIARSASDCEILELDEVAS